MKRYENDAKNYKSMLDAGLMTTQEYDAAMDALTTMLLDEFADS